MTIDRLGSVDPINNINKSNKAHKSNKSAGVDKIELSAEAKAQAEMHMAAEAAKSSPDIRMDKVEAAKARLNDPDYWNDERLLDGVADNLLDVFGL
jgi:anti-sigma28 factor (negative regulator of flagellin synthesis)